MNSDNRLTWDQFGARQAAEETGEEAEIQPKPAKKRPEPELSSLLLEAIHAAGARRGRLSRAERTRQATLLEVLIATMRR
jgi:hypothetical protein